MALIGQLWSGKFRHAEMRQALMAIMEVVNMNVNHANNMAQKKNNEK